MQQSAELAYSELSMYPEILRFSGSTLAYRKSVTVGFIDTTRVLGIVNQNLACLQIRQAGPLEQN